MRKAKPEESGWDVAGALASLRARIDPYIWEQGQELFRRGAVEDFAVLGDGTIQVEVLDPRDARRFFVSIKKDGGRVAAVCACPYRFEGSCRHQVVALEYLRGVADAAGAAGPAGPAPAPAAAPAPAPAPAAGSILYRFSGEGSPVKTQPDGSLLRVALLRLGSLKSAHEVALQLFTGTGWTEVRTPDVERWIARGPLGPHPRDALLARRLAADGSLRREVDSETFASILEAVKGTPALVDRGGREIRVSPWPWSLAARLVRASAGDEEATIGVELACRSGGGDRRSLEDVALVPSVSPWIQLEDGSFHPLVAGASGPVIDELQVEDHAAIPLADLDRFLTEGVPRLEQLCLGACESEPDLIRDVEGVDAARVRLEGSPARLDGCLELSYGGQWVEAPEHPEPWTVSREGKVHRYPPAGQSLARARRELEALGFRREDGLWLIDGQGVMARLLAPRPPGFVRLELPPALAALDLVSQSPLLELDVRVAGGAGWPAGAAGAGGAGGGGEAGAARARSGISWFEVSPRLTASGRELPVDLDRLCAAAQDAGSRGGSGLLELDDGTVLSLEHECVRSLADLAAEAKAAGAGGGASRGAIRAPLFLAGELLDERSNRAVVFDEGTRAVIEGLRAGGSESAAALRGETAAILRPYQRSAVGWLDRLGRLGLGGILADEMGLGKTLMTLAHFFGHEPAAGDAVADLPVLVVCPTSLSFNWLDECRRFFPAARAASLTGEEPAARLEILRAGADLLVTSYALLRRDREALEAREFRAIVLDEAQHVKNPESQTAQAAFALRAGERWALTGTPVENQLGDLWSIFRFALPGFLGDAGRFQETFVQPIARGEEGAQGRLRARVRPFLLRRTKEEVLPDLPPRIEQVERVAMTGAQRRLYEDFLQRARQELEAADPGRSRFQVLAALTRLRQICCHPRLVLGAAEAAALGDEATGGKFELLEELLDECLDEGHRVLLFSQFTSMLDLIEERLEARGIARLRLDGETRDREGVVRRFQTERSVPLFLVSLKAGGFGLNLTAADTVILYDPWWNPAVEEQAAARAHRLGQTVPVHVHKLVAADTVEEKILDLQARKRDVAAAVFASEEEALGALGAEELYGVLFD